MKQLTYGTKIESEHADVMRFIRRHLKKKKHLPSNNAVFRAIAKSHLKEDKRYYIKLKKAKL